ncbi:hypothetical protein GTO89_11125 [Heliobacterium gestii]|uniref:PRC-barrel domain-containing protein n=1 Tax=Heliomicrobium gestii TaxID=2699 RepID=A0A845LJJ8_HELGE|nr:PRC-barrel domain-containing protein [Heliomicrobium gestii]MBM7867326.1 uncharacterized protein YrrD [Heliomicrobium gestii]MZP43593.1 hypothetical protein [Heliomicrobium gestii]
MTKSQNIIGLAIISINDGRELGLVRDLIINPDQGSVEYLMVENESWYLGAQVIPFERLQGVGEDAVTIESEEALQRLTEMADVQGLIQRQVKVKGTKVLTKRGRRIGIVNEYFVDVSSGKITGCLLMPSRQQLAARIIPAESVVTYGRDVLIVVEDMDEAKLVEYKGDDEDTVVAAPAAPAAPAPAPAQVISISPAAVSPATPVAAPESAPAPAPVAAASETASSIAYTPVEDREPLPPVKEPLVEKEPALRLIEDLSVSPQAVEADMDPVARLLEEEDKPKEAEPFAFPALEKKEVGEVKPEGGDGQERGALFGQMQHKYYVGKVLTKTITNNLGEVVAEDGDIITEEMIEKVRQSGKYLEMIMNVKD